MTDISELRNEIEKLKERNRKVEANKAWELSWTRKAILFLLTYLVAGITLQKLSNSSPWTNALIPAIGFFLSTLTLPIIRDIWVKHIYRK